MMPRGIVAEHFPMKRELKASLQPSARNAFQCSRALPYEEGTESANIAAAAQLSSTRSRALPYEEGTESYFLASSKWITSSVAEHFPMKRELKVAKECCKRNCPVVAEHFPMKRELKVSMVG